MPFQEHASDEYLESLHPEVLDWYRRASNTHADCHKRPQMDASLIIDLMETHEKLAEEHAAAVQAAAGGAAGDISHDGGLRA